MDNAKLKELITAAAKEIIDLPLGYHLSKKRDACIDILGAILEMSEPASDLLPNEQIAEAKAKAEAAAKLAEASKPSEVKAEESPRVVQ